MTSAVIEARLDGLFISLLDLNIFGMSAPQNHRPPAQIKRQKRLNQEQLLCLYKHVSLDLLISSQDRLQTTTHRQLQWRPA